MSALPGRVAGGTDAVDALHAGGGRVEFDVLADGVDDYPTGAGRLLADLDHFPLDDAFPETRANDLTAPEVSHANTHLTGSLLVSMRDSHPTLPSGPGNIPAYRGESESEKSLFLVARRLVRMVAPFASSPMLSLLVLAVVAVSTALVLTFQRAPVTRSTVLAAAPWMVVGGILEALVATGAYRGVVATLLGPPRVHLAALVLGAVTWVPLLQVAAFRNRHASGARYLGTAGAGAALVLVLVLFWRVSVDPSVVLWLVTVPIAAAGLAGVAYFLLGLGDAAPLAYTGLVGLLVVFAHALDGLAVGVAVEVFGRAPRAPLAAAVADLAGGLSLPFALPGGWLFVAVKLLGALLVVQVFARYARRAETGSYLALGALAAAGLGPGVATLLSLAAG